MIAIAVALPVKAHNPGNGPLGMTADLVLIYARVKVQGEGPVFIHRDLQRHPAMAGKRTRVNCNRAATLTTVPPHLELIKS